MTTKRHEKGLPFVGGVTSDTDTTTKQWEDQENLLPAAQGGLGLKPRCGVESIVALTTDKTSGCVVFLVQLDDNTQTKLIALMNASTGQVVYLGEYAEQFGRKAQEPWVGGLDPDDPGGPVWPPLFTCKPVMRFDDSVPISGQAGGEIALPIVGLGGPGSLVESYASVLDSNNRIATNAFANAVSAKAYAIHAGLDEFIMLGALRLQSTPEASGRYTAYLYNPLSGILEQPTVMEFTVQGPPPALLRHMFFRADSNFIYVLMWDKGANTLTGYKLQVTNSGVANPYDFDYQIGQHGTKVWVAWIDFNDSNYLTIDVFEMAGATPAYAGSPAATVQPIGTMAQALHGPAVPGSGSWTTAVIHPAPNGMLYAIRMGTGFDSTVTMSPYNLDTLSMGTRIDCPYGLTGEYIAMYTVGTAGFDSLGRLPMHVTTIHAITGEKFGYASYADPGTSSFELGAPVNGGNPVNYGLYSITPLQDGDAIVQFNVGGVRKAYHVVTNYSTVNYIGDQDEGFAAKHAPQDGAYYQITGEGFSPVPTIFGDILRLDATGGITSFGLSRVGCVIMATAGGVATDQFRILGPGGYDLPTEEVYGAELNDPMFGAMFNFEFFDRGGDDIVNSGNWFTGGSA